MSTIYIDPEANENSTIPTNVFVSNVNDTSFQINWTTMEPTKGYVNYGKTSSGLNKNVLDVRDSSLEVQRFTHSVTISDGSLTGGDSIFFKLVSNSKLYGQNGGNTPYEFVVPEILSSPPSPSAINGKLDYLSSSRLSSTHRDFIIYGKVKNDQGGLSTYVSTVPAYNSNGWTLSVGQARNSALNDVVDFESIDIFVLGEYNSLGQETNDNVEEVSEVTVSPGLSLDILRHNMEIASISGLAGTAFPSSDVTVSIDGTTFTTSSDTKGEWEVSINGLASGDHKIEINNNSQVLGMSVNINLDVLPNTGLSSDVVLTIIGFGFIFCGFVIVYYARKKRITSPSQSML